MQNYGSWNDETLKFRSFRIIADGAAPFKKWGKHFIPDFIGMPLREKSFAIWLYTLLDYVVQENIFYTMISELKDRSVKVDMLIKHFEHLVNIYKNILSLYSKAEQLFLWSLRDQDVHGAISLWSNPEPVRKWYDTKNIKVITEKIPIDDYRKLLNPLYKTMPETIALLIKRFINSGQLEGLQQIINEEYSDDAMISAGRQLGLTINDHRKNVQI